MFTKVFGLGLVAGVFCMTHAASAQSFPATTSQSLAEQTAAADAFSDAASFEALLDDEEVVLSPKDECIAKCTKLYLAELKSMGDFCDSLYFSWHRILCYKIQTPIRDGRYKACKDKC